MHLNPFSRSYPYQKVATDSPDEKEAISFFNKQAQEVNLTSNYSLPELPPEVWLDILSRLEFTDLLNLSLVSVKFNQLTGLKYFQHIFKGLNTVTIENVATSSRGITNSYAWLRRNSSRPIIVEDIVDIENAADEELGKANIYAWLRESSPGPIRVKLLNYLYLLMKPDKIFINPDSDFEAGFSILNVPYKIDSFMQWLEENRFSLTEAEARSLTTENGIGRLEIDLAKLQKYSSLTSNKILKLSNEQIKLLNRRLWKTIAAACACTWLSVLIFLGVGCLLGFLLTYFFGDGKPISWDPRHRV
jgi:hypothetical protein